MLLELAIRAGAPNKPISIIPARIHHGLIRSEGIESVDVCFTVGSFVIILVLLVLAALVIFLRFLLVLVSDNKSQKIQYSIFSKDSFWYFEKSFCIIWSVFLN